MAKLTNAQLAAENSALRDQLNTQALIHAQELAIIRTKIANAQPSPNLIRDQAAGAAQHTQWRRDANERLAKMHAARDEAITTGRFVKVSA